MSCPVRPRKNVLTTILLAINGLRVSQRSIKCFVSKREKTMLNIVLVSNVHVHMDCSCHSTFMTVARYKAFCAFHKDHSLNCHEILFILTVVIQRRAHAFGRTFFPVAILFLYVISLSHDES